MAVSDPGEQFYYMNDRVTNVLNNHPFYFRILGTLSSYKKINTLSETRIFGGFVVKIFNTLAESTIFCTLSYTRIFNTLSSTRIFGTLSDYNIFNTFSYTRAYFTFPKRGFQYSCS